MTKEERENILDKHKTLYDGYAVRGNQPNMTPLYTQDLANDKGGITVNSKGEVGKYNNKIYIKESQDMCEQCGSKLVEGECMECGGGKMYEEETCEQCGSEMEEGIYDVKDLGHSKFDYTEKEIDEGAFSRLIGKVKKEIGYHDPEDTKRPYMADAVEKIIKLIKGVKDERQLESVKNMIKNLEETNAVDMKEVYRKKINDALDRKADELGVRLSKKEYEKIMKEVKDNLEFSDDIDEVSKSIKESLEWFNKFKKYN